MTDRRSADARVTGRDKGGYKGGDKGGYKGGDKGGDEGGNTGGDGGIVAVETTVGTVNRV